MDNKYNTQSPTDLLASSINHYRQKANHNKVEALACFITIISTTLIAPLFVTLGEGLVAGKIIPSVLSLFAAGTTAWLQLRKPQLLWMIYRTAERQLEDHAIRFHYKIGIYKASKDPEKILIESIADINISTHNEWSRLIPSPESLKLMSSERHAKDDESTNKDK